MKMTPYIFFDGCCREAFEFYAEVLDGRLEVSTFGEAPPPHDFPPEWRDKVMNVQLVAEDAELMGSDAPPSNPTGPMSGFRVSIQVDDEARGERVFAALAEGGEVAMPFAPTFWAGKFGMVTDRFGTPWMVSAGAPG